MKMHTILSLSTTVFTFMNIQFGTLQRHSNGLADTCLRTGGETPDWLYGHIITPASTIEYFSLDQP
jgi:hypothetical protein